MIDFTRATRHERGVIVAALRHYETLQHAKASTAAKTETRAIAGANQYVASDLLRQATTA